MNWRPESEYRDEIERLRNALHDLLKNPFPYDLLRIRHEVCSEFKGDETAAREEMECWCSDKECMDAITAHNFARKRALDILSNITITNPSPERTKDNEQS